MHKLRIQITFFCSRQTNRKSTVLPRFVQWSIVDHILISMIHPSHNTSLGEESSVVNQRSSWALSPLLSMYFWCSTECTFNADLFSMQFDSNTFYVTRLFETWLKCIMHPVCICVLSTNVRRITDCAWRVRFCGLPHITYLHNLVYI